MLGVTLNDQYDPSCLPPGRHRGHDKVSARHRPHKLRVKLDRVRLRV